MNYLQGKGLRMIQNIFKRMIDEIYIEYFKPNDWKKQGSNYRLFDDSGLGKIINFQKSKWSDVTTIEFYINYICLFDYLFISSQMSAKPYFIGSTGILLLW